jgi:hypothetical protein
MDRTSFAQIASLFTRNSENIAPKIHTNAFEYTPLDEAAHEIKLLTLLPGRFSEDVHINFRTEKLTATQIPKYEALSYVCGSIESPKIIFDDTYDEARLALPDDSKLVASPTVPSIAE